MFLALEMIGFAFALAMAAIFAFACAHSVLNWPDYAATVVNYRLMPAWAARIAAVVLPPLQGLAVVLLLVTPFRGALLGLGLMAVFTGAIAINMARGRSEIDCGCGGASGQSLSWGLVARNIVLTLCLLMVLGAPGRMTADGVSVIGGAGAGVFLVAIYFAADQMLANAQAFARARA